MAGSLAIVNVFGGRMYLCALWFSLALLGSPPLHAALTLEQAVAMARDHDPWLRGSELRESALMAESTAAGTLPDPVVSLGVANLPTDSWDWDATPRFTVTDKGNLEVTVHNVDMSTVAGALVKLYDSTWILFCPDHGEMNGELGLVDWPEQFLLHASGPVVHFGHRRDDHDQELWDGAAWADAAPGRFVLLDDQRARACFSDAAASPLGFAHRRHWVLVGPGGADAACVVRGNAAAGRRYTPGRLSGGSVE